ncbi:hypothetical protein L208DRAFT_1249811 [Tricholoma matsutake]|nr:hypothetical protein L208DRAFT_1249811 [Tricholoma matsutake 945]
MDSLFKNKPRFKGTTTLRKSSKKIKHPPRTEEDNKCFVVKMMLHNLEAYVLLNSGCTTNSILPEFTMSVNLKAHEFEEPVPLQLSTVGSRSKINFGLFTDFEIGGVVNTHYFDVVNINRYDATLGTMFMRKHGIVLDFEHDEVRIKGKRLNTVIEGPNTFMQARWHAIRHPTAKKVRDLDNIVPKWKQSCQDILSRVPDKLPPLREINHHIPLVDEKKKYNYYFPKCPDSMRKPLSEKVAKYCRAGWWRPAQAEQAAPMLVVLKKSGAIRTVINAVKRNVKTVKDVTPFPDQDMIHLDVA